MLLLLVNRERTGWYPNRKYRQESQTQRTLGRGRVESGRSKPASDQAGWMENKVTSHEPHNKAQIRDMG